MISDAQPTSIKLIYSGRILKDNQRITECNIQSGHTIHLVKSSGPSSKPAEQPAQPNVEVQSQPQETPQSPSIAMPQAYMNVFENMNDQQHVAMDQVMSRMMDEMANNPQLMHTMLASHPEVQLSPQAMQLTQDPNFLRWAAQMTRSGALNDPAFRAAQNTVRAAGVPAAAQEMIDPEVKFAGQLQQLNDMGFWDKKSNIQALLISNGSVSQAVEYLLSHPPE